jgi:hypothetical protein
MSHTNMLTRLLQQTHDPIQWEDVIVGFDFGLLEKEDVLDWIHRQRQSGYAIQRMDPISGNDLLHFEVFLRVACEKDIGRVPRIGNQAWMRGQDRWRIALLRDALEASPSEEALSKRVESVYASVGCPEDMLGLWSAPHYGDQRPHHAERKAVERFVQSLEERRRQVAAA